MRTGAESETTLDERFLMISNVLGSTLIDDLDKKLVPESIGRWRAARAIDGAFQTATFDPAAAAFLRRRRGKNELVCYTLYAYADVPVGRTFDVIFHAANRVSSATKLQLKHAVLSLGDYLMPVPELSLGNKHYCIFDAPNGIPKLLENAPKAAHWTEIDNAFRWGLTTADAWVMLSANYG